MSVKMRKAGNKDCSVNEDAVANFEADGWKLIDGAKAEAAPTEDDGGADGLTESEKQREIDAACKIVRDKGEAEGLSEEEIDANVGAERERVTAELA